ncbi:unnamed protein product [Dibothriocephalus latus]|uniref:Uncharacterized protein n=1 Tax=Dibothriocephalus latus TaxID=60516 RepID=A0A3P7LIF6_DIBLA|nr:unnamed protein product [Dibothriocephalus latus]
MSTDFEGVKRAVAAFEHHDIDSSQTALEVNDTSWINLEPNRCTIYGVVLKSAVAAGFHEFRIDDLPDGTSSQVTIRGSRTGKVHPFALPVPAT